MRIHGIIALLASTGLGIGCSSNQNGEVSLATSVAALTPTSSVSVSAWSMTVNLPTWGNLGAAAQVITGQQGVSLGANSGAGVVIECASSNKRHSVIAAAGPITVQPDAKVVDLVATGTVDLRDRVNVVGNVTAPNVTLGNNVIVAGSMLSPTSPVPGDSLIWIASTPAGTVSGWDLQPGQSQTISPGRYGNIAVKSTAKLILNTPGRYFLESLDLEPGSNLQLPSGDQGTEIYVHGNQLILRGNLSGSTNIEERLAIIYGGNSDVFVESPLVGAIVANSANVTLRSLSAPHKGSVWGKTVNLDAGAKLQPVAQLFLVALGTLPVDKCSWSIRPKSTGNAYKDEVNFQYEMLRYCIAPGMTDNLLHLNGQHNYDSAAAAAAAYGCTIQPNQYLGFVRRRHQQLAAASANSVLAQKIVAGPDADGDWVPDVSDHCANTPKWTAVDDSGCPISPPSGGPSCSDIKSVLDRTGFIFNPKCPASAQSMPKVAYAVAAYWKQTPEKGVYAYVEDIGSPGAGCDPWYEMEIRSIKGVTVIDHFNVAFPYAQASHTGSIVPSIPKPFVELHAEPSAPNNVGRVGQLAAAKEARTIDKVLWRLRAVSGIGAKGGWSMWQEFIPQDCKAVGFTCIK